MLFLIYDYFGMYGKNVFFQNLHFTYICKIESKQSTKNNITFPINVYIN